MLWYLMLTHNATSSNTCVASLLSFNDYEAIYFQLSKGIEHIMSDIRQQHHHVHVDTLRPGTNDRHFADGISDRIFLNKI